MSDAPDIPVITVADFSFQRQSSQTDAASSDATSQAAESGQTFLHAVIAEGGVVGTCLARKRITLNVSSKNIATVSVDYSTLP